MARMKKLAGYLNSRCQDWYDLDDGEFRKICKEADIDPETFTTTFSHYELLGNSTVRWWYDCPACGKQEFKDFPIEPDFVYVGSCPSEESVVFPSLVSCQALIRQMKATIGKEPEGAKMVPKMELGGGGYYEVVVKFSPAFPYSVAYAYMAEDSLPKHWTKASLEHIAKLKNHC